MLLLICETDVELVFTNCCGSSSDTSAVAILGWCGREDEKIWAF